jgi:hypothetical protein
MNDDTPSSHQPPTEPRLLTRTSTLQKFFLQEIQPEEQGVRRVFDEYRLRGQRPESLKDFIVLSLKKNGTYDKNRIIWIGEGAFAVGISPGESVPRFPGVYQEQRF